MSNAFDEFLNGLELPDLPPSEPSPLGAEEMEELLDSVRASVRHDLTELVRKTVDEVVEAGTDRWSEMVNLVMFEVYQYIADHTEPDESVLRLMTKEQIFHTSMRTYLTLGLIVYDKVMRAFGDLSDEQHE